MKIQKWITQGVLLATLLGVSTISQAQLQWGGGKILQNGISVGMFFRDKGPAGACEYTEVWYLTDRFRYVGAVSGMTTKLVPMPEIVVSKASFLKEVKQSFSGRKGKFVTSHVTEPFGACGDQHFKYK